MTCDHTVMARHGAALVDCPICTKRDLDAYLEQYAPNLNAIASKHGTDKAATYHDYCRTYERYFGPRRYAIKRVLEIGILHGQSLRTWRDYFPNANIVGVDNDHTIFDLGPRIVCIHANAHDPNALAALADQGPWDIIIDDGSHMAAAQALAANALLPSLAPRGFYVIEDFATGYWAEFQSDLMPQPSEGALDLATRRLINRLTDAVNKRGLRAHGDRRAAICFDHYDEGDLDWWELNIEAVHLHNSLVVIERRP
jgi:hypothetical protein